MDIKQYTYNIWLQYKSLIISYLVITILLLTLYPSEFWQSISDMNSTILYSVFRDQPFLFIPSIGLAIYCLICIFTVNKQKNELLRILQSLIMVFIFFALASRILDTIFLSASVQSVIFWSNSFMEADRILFHIYPFFWLHHTLPPILGSLSTIAYDYTAIVVAYWSVFLLFYKKGIHFNSFITKILIAVVICVPLWIIFPASMPGQMYIDNIFHQTISDDIKVSLAKTSTSPTILRKIVSYDHSWTDLSGERLITSNFPSMHTIWIILLIYSVAQIIEKRIFTIITIIFGLAVITGAVYLLQHYVVDILAGLMIGIVVSKIK